jgi:hypothetical protein
MDLHHIGSLAKQIDATKSLVTLRTILRMGRTLARDAREDLAARWHATRTELARERDAARSAAATPESSRSDTLQRAAEPAERAARPEAIDPVERASLESFPASDPPSWSGTTARHAASDDQS